MDKIRLLILCGGRSTEHEVSVRSAISVLEHLDRDRFEVSVAFIHRSGHWYLTAECSIAEPAAQRVIAVLPGAGLAVVGSGAPEPLPIDVVFPVLHGTFGEDGTVQGLLELAGVPYVGAGVTASAIGMDKAHTKLLWQQHGLPVVPYAVCRPSSAQPPGYAETAAAVAAAVQRFGLPLFVKPARGGSSVGVQRAESQAEATAAVHEAYRFDDKVLIEPAVDAREIEVSVIGTQPPRVFAPGEVIPNSSFYDYDAKYTDPNGARLVVPADLPPRLSDQIRDIARAAFVAIEADGMARIDFLLDRSTATPYLNEVNTIPGFTSISMFPRMCAADGLSFRDLLTTLVELALERRQHVTAQRSFSRV